LRPSYLLERMQRDLRFISHHLFAGRRVNQILKLVRASSDVRRATPTRRLSRPSDARQWPASA
jgi:hypothetical protein